MDRSGKVRVMLNKMFFLFFFCLNLMDRSETLKHGFNKILFNGPFWDT